MEKERRPGFFYSILHVPELYSWEKSRRKKGLHAKGRHGPYSKQIKLIPALESKQKKPLKGPGRQTCINDYMDHGSTKLASRETRNKAYGMNIRLWATASPW